MDENKLRIANTISPFNVHNGIKISYYDDTRSVVEGELCREALNPWGIAHGGFIYSLCDVAAGVLASGTGKKSVTMSSSMHYLHQSKGTRLRAEGRVIKNGKTVMLIETNVYDDEGIQTARGEFELFHVE